MIDRSLPLRQQQAAFTRDRLLVRRQGIRAKQIIPRARLVRLPGCGHVPMNDDPALVARVILDGSR